jgi:hypothetical protein
MTAEPFYPDGPMPERRETAEFVLRPLRATDVEQDYEAVMESRERLRGWGGGRWPWDEFTLADNLGDLEEHEGEHLAREAFTYTVLDPSEQTCLGCVYINPLRRLLAWGQASEEEQAAVTDNDAVVRFWIRTSRLDEGLEERLLEELRRWFHDEWSFPRLCFRTNENDRQMQTFPAAGLSPRYSLGVPDRNGRYVVFE